MAMKRGYPGGSSVRKGKRVGPDYPDEYFRNPVNAGVEHEYNMGKDDRTLESPNEETVTLAGQKMHDKYDSYWGSGREYGKGRK